MPQDQFAAEGPARSRPEPGFEEQNQAHPGLSGKMDPEPDYGEETYRGAGQLAGKRVLITGADSGIGPRSLWLSPARAPM